MIRILLVEAESNAANGIGKLFNHKSSKKYQLSTVKTAAEAITVLTSPHTLDVVIADEALPDSHGTRLVTDLRHAAPYLPIMIIGNSDNDRLVSTALKAGVQDYLRKDHLESETLQRATRYAIERQKAQNLMTHAVENTNRIREQAAMLSHQKKQLIELNQAKDEFISLSSHQLRTPATSVKQYLGMVLEGFTGKVPPHLRVFLKTAYDSNERQLTIINDLLRAAQITSEKYAMRKEQADLTELAQAVIDDYMPIIRLRKQQIQLSSKGDCSARLDASEMRIVLANLIENASKYSPESTTITIATSRNKNSLHLTVKDQGVGIPAPQLKKIFEKFIRIDNELSDTVSGSGLGLYFVRRIVKLHGGRVKVTSTVGDGSTFTVTLPL